jgi:hypothetical protein
MFKECPRKLADVNVNNLAYLTPGRQPPEAKEVEKLYQDFWRKVGPPNPPIPEGCASEYLIHEYFPPIITAEINERLKKIRDKTTAGLDGL